MRGQTGNLSLRLSHEERGRRSSLACGGLWMAKELHAAGETAVFGRGKVVQGLGVAGRGTGRGAGGAHGGNRVMPAGDGRSGDGGGSAQLAPSKKNA